MELDGKQKRRADILFRFLKPQPESFFKNSKIYRCPSCDGSGLNAQRNSDGTFSWDTHTYCDDCCGTGHRGLSEGLQIDDTHYLCKFCNGIGCERCDQGITDWVAHAMG
jgi:DnaJ-class molecular chaperone